MNTPGVGIIGAGHIASSHARVWQSESTVVAVCSRQRHKAERLASEFNILTVVDDTDALIGREEVDIVCITTPHHLHHPFAMKAIEAGKHVFCEKPLAMNGVEAKEMWEASVERGVRTGIQFSERFHWPSLIYLKEMIDRGELGDIRSFEGAWAFDWAKSPDHPMSWRFRKGMAGTGALGDLGAYMIDAARWLIGDIAEVCGHLETHVERRPVVSDLYDFAEVRRMHRDDTLPESTETAIVENDDACYFLLKFKNNATGMIRASRMQRYNTLLVEGSDGVCKWDLQTRNLMHRANDRDEYREVPIPDHITSRSMVTQFLANIRDQTDFPPTFYDGLKVQEVIDAVVTSSLEKRWVSP